MDFKWDCIVYLWVLFCAFSLTDNTAPPNDTQSLRFGAYRSLTQPNCSLTPVGRLNERAHSTLQCKNPPQHQSKSCNQHEESIRVSVVLMNSVRAIGSIGRLTHLQGKTSADRYHLLCVQRAASAMGPGNRSASLF